MKSVLVIGSAGLIMQDHLEVGLAVAVGIALDEPIGPPIDMLENLSWPGKRPGAAMRPSR